MLTLTHLRPHLLSPDLSEAQCLRLIKEMNQAFTSKREAINNYVLSPDFVSAYSLLYLTTNFPKLNFLLDQLNHELVKQFESCDFIDYGCGPGTYSLAWLQRFTQFAGNIHCIDQSPLMIEQAKKFIAALHPQYSGAHYTNRYQVMNKADRQRPLVLFFGHSLNELGRTAALKLIKEIDPDFVLFIEPGTKDFFADALFYRQELLSQAFSINYPCLSQSACPMLSRPDDWCHQVLQLTHPPDVERLCQMASLDRRHLPLIAFCFSKSAPSQVVISARYLQMVEENKFCFILAVCQEEAGQLIYRHFELLKRYLDNKSVKALRALSIGSTLEFECEKILTQDKWRVKIKKLA